MYACTIIPWIGTVLQAGGALWVAANVRSSRWAFPLMLIGALIWTAVAVVEQNWALAAMNATFAGINIVGIVRWRK